jgi:hypothetical protein
MDLDNVKYAHVVNIKAYKDDPHKVVVFVPVRLSMSQVDIISNISNMQDSLHLKSCEKGRFKVAKFPIRTTRLIHQMWDEMVTMIVIKKDNRMVTTFEAIQTNVEGFLVIRAPKKQKKEATIEEKRKKNY